jgi:hypothetical protein
MNTVPGATLTEALDLLITKLREHEQAADEIRAQLRDLKRRIASGGRRAGAKARSGRKRKIDAQPTIDDGARIAN